MRIELSAETDYLFFNFVPVINFDIDVRNTPSVRGSRDINKPSLKPVRDIIRFVNGRTIYLSTS